jgi:hypothetical protein
VQVVAQTEQASFSRERDLQLGSDHYIDLAVGDDVSLNV